MKINKINLPESETSNYGLEPIKMDRMSNIVLIAGKNGSGKSRLLNCVKDFISSIPKDNELMLFKRELEIYKENLSRLFDLLKLKDKDLISMHGNNREYYENEVKNIKNNISRLEILLGRIDFISFENYNQGTKIIDFVPKSLDLTDSYKLSQSNNNTYANRIYNIGIDSLSAGAIPEIERVVKRWVNIKIGDGLEVSEDEKVKIEENYNKLKDYIKLFLNTDLKRDGDGNVLLFSRRIGEANLSDGQKILLQFCMALFAQEAKLEDLIIFMDEPENHLHPAALIEVIEKIIPHVSKGQIWIATHSINVLAHFDPSNIWYMENGKITYAGNIPNVVLDGLLGDEHEIEKLSSFLSLPAVMAMNKFAYECLLYPEVVFTGRNDPQTGQIHEIFSSRFESGGKLKVLDFGIGKGRLLSAIAENESLNGHDITDKLDYYGYDIVDTFKHECEGLLVDIYGNCVNRYFNESDKLISNIGENSIDFIVMCNVLHEIEPKFWQDLFLSETSVFKTLKDDGYLLIIEDQYLAIGEKAHANGFLVLDELELKKLFNMDNEDGYLSTDYRNDGRLKSHHIPKKCIERFNRETKRNALQTLLQRSKDKMRLIRGKDNPNFKDGKLHAFWSQQLANATLAIDEL
ncbi:AAA family ATPase [Empedobacter brevis]|uniref:AAA family ATPase n=1 Tax=Empedobacter brevis TaxID=247 RepID=UPI0033429514